MAEPILSVDIVLQNNTNELLTMEGAVLMRGEWGAPAAPRRGDVVEKQASAKWVNFSKTEGVGAQGSLHLGSTKGYIDIEWNLRYDDVKFTHKVVTPPQLPFTVHMSMEVANYPVMVVTLSTIRR